MKINLKKVSKNNISNLNIIRKDKSLQLHKSRLKSQEKGDSIYLIVFEDKLPVGHVFIVFKGTEKYHKCPILQDLFVKENLRKKGFGKTILNKVERYLKDKGYKKVGLDVETKEKWLIKFYRKEGYSIIGKPHKQKWIEKDSRKKITLNVYYMEKDID